MGIADRRLQYETAGLDIDDLLADPIAQLQQWYRQAEEAGAAEPNAMVVSTVDAEGQPDARVVLARNIDANGVTFFTNRHSAKGEQIGSEARGAATFAWLELHRQVRIRGVITWASPQSEPIGNREELNDLIDEVAARFDGVDVPRPPHWGGYVISINSIEFWQGRPSRLHDRFLYTRHGNVWRAQRLAP